MQVLEEERAFPGQLFNMSSIEILQ